MFFMSSRKSLPMCLALLNIQEDSFGMTKWKLPFDYCSILSFILFGLVLTGVNVVHLQDGLHAVNVYNILQLYSRL
jgi:hypothetical protein